jgi:hypothetical protein
MSVGAAYLRLFRRQQSSASPALTSPVLFAICDEYGKTPARHYVNLIAEHSAARGSPVDDRHEPLPDGQYSTPIDTSDALRALIAGVKLLHPAQASRRGLREHAGERL